MSIDELLAGLSVIAGLVVLEGLLSVDNVLGIAALANELPEAQQRKAVRIGLALAYVFRVLALLIASWLASNTWVRWLGAGYLIWLMSSHLTKHHGQDADDSSPAADGVVKATATAGLAVVLVQIGLMDLSLSIDNVIAAVGLAPKTDAGTPVMWPIYAGVFIAIVALQAIAPHAMKLLKKYPVLEPTAFILIGYVGLLLIAEEAAHAALGAPIHVPAYAKFAGIVSIIFAALLYDAHRAVRTVLTPLIRFAMPAMRGVTRAVALLLWPLEYLLEFLTMFGTMA